VEKQILPAEEDEENDSHPIGIQVALRMLVSDPETRGAFLATESELVSLFKLEVKPAPPLLLQLDEWIHPDITNGQTPGQSPSFQAVAKVLVTKNPQFNVKDEPNTHWSNWPTGGTL
jgi:hypothetical protein